MSFSYGLGAEKKAVLLNCRVIVAVNFSVHHLKEIKQLGTLTVTVNTDLTALSVPIVTLSDDTRAATSSKPLLASRLPGTPYPDLAVVACPVRLLEGSDAIYSSSPGCLTSANMLKHPQRLGYPVDP